MSQFYVKIQCQCQINLESQCQTNLSDHSKVTETRANTGIARVLLRQNAETQVLFWQPAGSFPKLSTDVRFHGKLVHRISTLRFSSVNF